MIAGIRLGIGRRTTDNRLRPTTGYEFNTGYEQLAGDHTFGLVTGSHVWYRTLHEDLAEQKTVLALKLLGATAVGDAPPFEKFYAGGTGEYGIRGFRYRGISTRAGINDDPVGSDWIFLANAEVTVPLVSESLAALFFIDSGVDWALKDKDGSIKTVTGDCPNDYLPYLVENEVTTGICTPCAQNRNLDEAKFHTNMALDGGPHLIDMAAEAKVFNF